jgi:hypothetical protein
MRAIDMIAATERVEKKGAFATHGHREILSMHAIGIWLMRQVMLAL